MGWASARRLRQLPVQTLHTEMRDISYSKLLLPHLRMGEQVLEVIWEHLQCVNASYVLSKVINFKLISLMQLWTEKCQIWLLIWGEAEPRGLLATWRRQNKRYFQQVWEILIWMECADSKPSVSRVCSAVLVRGWAVSPGIFPCPMGARSSTVSLPGHSWNAL